MSDLISIIVTIYNVEGYLHKCINSILQQTYKNFELILVNDGSTDGSGDICDYYAQIDKRVVVLHKKNEGLVAARKTGIKEAKGKYVGYVDADDWVDSNMYENLYTMAIESGADIVTSGRYEEYSDKTIVGKNKVNPGLYDKNNKQELYSKMIFSGAFFEFGVYPTVWDKLFKKELLLKNQLLVPDIIVIGEDVACTYPCMMEAESIYVSNEIFYHYRKREDSMLRTKDERYLERVFALQRYLYDRCSESNFEDILQTQIKAYIMDMILNGAKREYPFEYDITICHQYLFPFGEIPANSKIILYGAGNVGQKYYRQIKHSDYCSLVKWIDKKFSRLTNPESERCSPDDIEKLEYDYILLAVLDKEIADEIKKTLLDRGVKESKIKWSDPRY